MTLADFLKRNDLSQREFARLVPMSEPYLCEILKGARRPTVPMAQKISAATGGKVKAQALAFGEVA